MKKIKDLMTEKVAYVSPETSVTEAAQLMQKHNVGSTGLRGPKCGGDCHRPRYCRPQCRLPAGPQDDPGTEYHVHQRRVSHTGYQPEPGGGIVAEKQVRRLPVMEHNQLVGIVSLGDLATQAKYDVELARTLGEDLRPPSGRARCEQDGVLTPA